MEEKSSGSQYISEKIYERILRPILTVAKAKNFVEKVTNLHNTISNCYRVGSTAAKPGQSNPPPIVVKLCNPQLRIAILKCKKDSTPKPTDAEKAAGFKRFNIAEDLTPPAFKKLKELQGREESAKAWTIDGKIFFVMKDSTSIMKVSSVFDDIRVILNRAQF